MDPDLSFLLDDSAPSPSGGPGGPGRPGGPGSPEGAARARARGAARRNRRHVTVVAAVLTVLLGAGVAVARRPGGTDVETAAHPSARSARAGVPLPAPTAEELPAPPPVPDGWQLVDFEDVRIAVPGDWHLRTDYRGQCTNDERPILSLGTTFSAWQRCPEGQRFRSADAVIERRGSGDVTCAGSCGDQREVNGLRVTHSGTGMCQGPCGIYSVEDAAPVLYLPTARAEEILATLTWSPRARALHDGPRLDTAGWQEVRFGGLSALVPAGWPVVDLAAEPGRIPPGVCSMWFGQPEVLVDTNHLVPRCPAPVGPVPVADRHDGLWLVTDEDRLGPFPVEPNLTIGDLRVAQADAPLAPAIRVAVPVPGRPAVIVTVGLGPDPLVARTVLRSLALTDGGDTRSAIGSPTGTGPGVGTAPPGPSAGASSTTGAPGTDGSLPRVRKLGEEVAEALVHDGPLLDTAGWQLVQHDGISMRVPPEWSVQAMADRPDMLRPSRCGWNHPAASVVLGVNELAKSCGPPGGAPPPKQDGAWIVRNAELGLTPDGLVPDGVPPDSLTPGGPLVAVALAGKPTLFADLTGAPGVDPVDNAQLVVVAVSNGAVVNPAVVVVWIGPDPAVARTVAHSVTLAP